MAGHLWLTWEGGRKRSGLRILKLCTNEIGLIRLTFEQAAAFKVMNRACDDIDLVSFETADIEPFAVGVRVMAEAFQICGRGLVSDCDREGDGFWILRIHGIEGEG